MFWWCSDNKGQGRGETAEKESGFLLCQYKRLQRLKFVTFSTDDHKFFLVNECKVRYQRSHKFLCKAPMTVGTH